MNDVEVLKTGEEEYSLGDTIYKCLSLPSKNALQKKKYTGYILFIGKISFTHMEQFYNIFLSYLIFKRFT